MSTSYNLENILDALVQSWSAQTSSRPDQWSNENPARGQCVVSSLIIQDLHSGELRKYKTTYEGIPENHYCNVLPIGAELDSAKNQYPPETTFTESEIELKGFATVREKLLSDPSTQERYLILKESVLKLL